MNKSIKAVALLLTTLFFLFGCGGTQSSSYILKNEMAQTTTTVDHKGDTVTKITILNEWNLKAMGPDFPKQSAQALAQATLSLYTNLPGVTSSTSSTDEKITFEITIDMEKVDLAKLKERFPNEFSIEGNKLSFKSFEKNLFDAGYTAK